MDDHHHRYGMGSNNMRQYMNGTPIFTSVQTPQDMLSNHHYETIVMVGHHQRPTTEYVSHGLHSDSTTNTGGFGGMEMDGGGLGGGDGGSGRWPRQETLTLLEIRSRLDAKFKEANQKGPLWDEVSRIMYEEHGYQRSGKKCREKFENLYKYYKKTKEGKAGRQDGKHYRFFRQLEALYGDTTTTTNNNNYTPSDHLLVGSSSFRYNSNIGISNKNTNLEFISHHQATKSSEENSLSLSSSSDFETTSSEESNLKHNNNENSSSVGKRKKRSKRGWKTKIKEFIDAQMRKLMVKQECWVEKMMKTIEHKEQERIMREETWKKQEEERIEKEHKFWDKERAWIEARDAALMEALHKLTSTEIVPNDNASETITNLARGGESSWQECEITRLIQLRSGVEPRLFVQQLGCGQMLIWEEISSKMASFGYDKSPLMCKNKWESINDYLIKYQKRGKESSASCGGYFHGNDHSISQQVGGGGGGGGGGVYCDNNNNETAPTTSSSRGGGNMNDHGGNNSPPNCTTALNINDNCFRYFMGDADNNLWENYGVKLCKEENNH